MEYQGYKLIDKIMLICRDKSEHEDSSGWNRYKNTYQAYLVDPSNKKQIDAARRWAAWTEYGPSHKNEETGKWEREYEISHEPVEFEFENNGFTLELLDCAGGSSQGGKLSFWNCKVSKDENNFVIGIDSDMLLDLLKNASFDKGKCQSPLIFITRKGRVGMTVEGSESYQQCLKDKELKNTLKKSQTSKFSFGDRVSTPTIDEYYLGTITQYYKFDMGRNDRYLHQVNLRDCTLVKLDKPITYHMFESIYEEKTLTELIDYSYGNSPYGYPITKKTCPKRTISGKIELDTTEENFKIQLMKKIYDYEAFEKYASEHYYDKDSDSILYHFLRRSFFGFGFEPFELDEELMKKIRASGISYREK